MNPFSRATERVNGTVDAHASQMSQQADRVAQATLAAIEHGSKLSDDAAAEWAETHRAVRAALAAAEFEAAATMTAARYCMYGVLALVAGLVVVDVFRGGPRG